MKGSIRTGLATVAIMALALAASAEDLTISARITSRAGSSITTAYISETADRTTNGDLTVIVDYASGRKLTVDAGKKEYSETSFRAMAEGRPSSRSFSPSSAAGLERLRATGGGVLGRTAVTGRERVPRPGGSPGTTPSTGPSTRAP